MITVRVRYGETRNIRTTKARPRHTRPKPDRPRKIAPRVGSSLSHQTHGRFFPDPIPKLERTLRCEKCLVYQLA